MTLRTPRRRISPRTKRRYRAIRDFLRRALGTTSQPDTKTNSNISVSVSDLKQKNVADSHLYKVSQQYNIGLITVDDSHKSENLKFAQQNSKNKTSLEKNKTNPNETKVLYKTSENHYKKIVASDVTSKIFDASDADFKLQKQTNKITSKIDGTVAKNKNIIKKGDNGLDVVTKPEYNLNSRKKLKSYSTDSYCSSVDLVKSDSERHHPKRRSRLNYTNPIIVKESQKNKEDERINNIEYLVRKYEERSKRKKYKPQKKELDKEFIADIIRRQYKPTKLFSLRESGLSQMSAPLCRDQEFSVNEDVRDGSEICSCCYDKPKIRNGIRCTPSFSEVRSICDARLYSSKRNPRSKQNRKHQEYYNDSFYDLVPVKEKSSPKSRKKFADYNMIPYEHYKEVPPSPRSLRPRLNLTAQRYEKCDDFSPYFSRPHPKNSGQKSKVQRFDKNFEIDNLPKCIILGNDKVLSQSCVKHDSHIFRSDDEFDTSIPCPSSNQRNLSLHHLSINKTQEIGVTVDKTDKALYEIKDILQTFLEEMKKETTHSDKSDTSDKSLVKNKQEERKGNMPVLPNSSDSLNNTTNQFAPNPYIQAFPNTCCYPMVPICPINCVQNGFVIPAQSHTCSACTNRPKELSVPIKDATLGVDNTQNRNASDDTQQLIKEIYDFVKQTPQPKINAEYRDVSIDNTETSQAKPVPKKYLTSRSAGNSSNPSAHDVKVGTSQMKCYSKSCEAFGSKKASESIYSNGSYSDTVLEKLSLEAAANQHSDFDLSSIINMEVKPRRKKKFAKVLQSFGNLLKKRRKDVIEELSESESTMEMDGKPMSPYTQNVTNYMMHEEKYYQQPPLPSRYPYQTSPEYSYRPSAVIDSKHRYQHSPYAPTIQESGVQHASYPGTSSYSTSFEHRYNQVSPQVPLCLKEIEVKSIGTQSEIKKSFLEVLKSKMAGPKAQIDSMEETQKNVPKMIKKPGFLNWKNLQENSMQTNTALGTDLGFSLNYTQNQLRETDMTIRNTLLKRFFYKRNPFSLQNPLLQTLLGKDKPMAEPTNLLRPKMMM